MRTVVIALVASVLALASPGCSAPRVTQDAVGEAAVMSSVHRFVDAFNAGDAATAIALCADEMSIIDEFPPYEWHGAGTLSKWLADYDAHAQEHGITDGKVALGAPRCVDITADRAYVVASADYAFKVKGEPVKERGATFTFALRKVSDGWRITGWTWSKS